jgi:hypothetical protein
MDTLETYAGKRHRNKVEINNSPLNTYNQHQDSLYATDADSASCARRDSSNRTNPPLPPLLNYSSTRPVETTLKVLPSFSDGVGYSISLGLTFFNAATIVL